MRIVCPHCGGKARITSRATHTATASDLYCQCVDIPACGATFVFTLAFKHTLNPPTQTTVQRAAALVRSLTPDEREDMAAMVSPARD